MGRTAAIAWHGLFSWICLVLHAFLSAAGGALYFFFVLPRWPELMGDTTHALGTTLRIVAGVLIGLAAVPVLLILLRGRKPELGMPRLALSIRVWSVVAHVLAGLLIVGTAISEIWLTLDTAGRWLFGIYGAAAAIGLLGFFAFYLSFLAELPPPPPKPIKPKKAKERRRGRKKGAADETDEASEDTDEADATEETTEAGELEDTDDADDADDAETPAETEETEERPAETVVAEAAPEKKSEPDTSDTAAADAPTAEALAAEDTDDRGGLRNRRPTGKGSHRMRRRRTRGGVALDE